ncbi:MAG: hypothetical protein BJ554DRAFT_1016, partial [Olpidium bornovanus]
APWRPHGTGETIPDGPLVGRGEGYLRGFDSHGAFSGAARFWQTPRRSKKAEFEKVDEELETEQAALLRKYQKVRLPIYKKQRELVKSIPGFWKQVVSLVLAGLRTSTEASAGRAHGLAPNCSLISHPDVMQALDADDIDILGKVTDFCTYTSAIIGGGALNRPFVLGAQIDQHFENGNPHFTNTTLKKEVIRKKEGGFQLKHTPVDWIKGRKRKADPSDDGLFHSWFQFDDPEEASLFDIIKDDLLPKSLR